MMKLKSSKKASWVWDHLGELILLLAIIYLVLVGLIIPQTAKASKSTGCKGIASSVPGFVGEGEFFCYKGTNCPSESKKASDTKWAFSAGGCPSGYICCVGKKPVGLGEGKGVIEIRKDNAKGEKILQNTKDTPLIVTENKLTVAIWGTDEIKTCDVNLWVPGRKEKRPIKDNQDCKKAFTATLTFDRIGMYELDVIAYNEKKEQIASTKIYIQGSIKEPTAVFELYDGPNKIDFDQTYRTKADQLYYELSCEVECRVTVDGPYMSSDLMIGKNYYSISEEGEYVFTFRYKEGNKWKEKSLNILKIKGDKK